MLNSHQAGFSDSPGCIQPKQNHQSIPSADSKDASGGFAGAACQVIGRRHTEPGFQAGPPVPHMALSKSPPV